MLLLASEYGDVFSHNIAAVQEYWRTAMSSLREEPNKHAHATAKTAQVARYRLWRRLISARRPCIAEQ